MEPKRRSVFGLIVGILVALDAVMMYSNVNSMVSAAGSGAYALGTAIGARLVRPFLIFAFLSAVACLIGYFARFRWGYLTGMVFMIIGILELPAIIGVPTEPVILAVLMLIAFIIDSSKQKRQVEEAKSANDRSE